MRIITICLLSQREVYHVGLLKQNCRYKSNIASFYFRKAARLWLHLFNICCQYQFKGSLEAEWCGKDLSSSSWWLMLSKDTSVDSPKTEDFIQCNIFYQGERNPSFFHHITCKISEDAVNGFIFSLHESQTCQYSIIVPISWSVSTMVRSATLSGGKLIFDH